MLKRLIGIATAVATISSMAVTAFADEPYETYSYDNWQDPIPSQAGYMVEKTWTGHDLGLDELSNPESEFFISNNENPTLMVLVISTLKIQQEQSGLLILKITEF